MDTFKHKSQSLDLKKQQIHCCGWGN